MQPVHDLQILRRAGGRAQQPFAPGDRLLLIARGEQRIERQRRIADPAEAIVPIAHAADQFGQRGRRRRDDAAGRTIGQQLQRDERALDLRAPRALIGVERAPGQPSLLDAAQERDRVADRRRLAMRGIPSEDEGHVFAFMDDEFRSRRPIFVDQLDGRVEPHGVGTGDRDDALDRALDPGHEPAVIETEGNAHRYLDRTGIAANETNDLVDEFVAGRRHEIDDRRRAGFGLEAGFENGGAGPIAARDADIARFGANAPRAVPLVAQQRGEDRAGIEARQAEPIDRAVARDERRAVRVADDAVILDPPVLLRQNTPLHIGAMAALPCANLRLVSAAKKPRPENRRSDARADR